MTTTPRASILVPTHNKPSTLPVAVASALAQTVADVEVIIIGDGVTDDVRAAVQPLLADPRVRFLDLPKGPHHGEVHRHTAVLEARSDAILYLCDDDLFLRDHVADLLALLEDHDLVQCWNGFVTTSGRIHLFASDLSDPHEIAAHTARKPFYNKVSVTGTGHTRGAYLALDDPWETTPVGDQPDHHQFAKFMRRPGFRGATSSRMTALQLPTSEDGRDTWTADERLAELLRWWDFVRSPDAQDVLDEMCHTAARRALVEEGYRVRHFRDSVWWRGTALPRRLARTARAAVRGAP
ncbi:glycosyltransferase family 2 protein [Oryzobacter telluris]|uniref:glycosyltransferase family 2 protein n=1 Tax=Oryzobacter telluris TaxID=3149179 RepID=UPI00370D09C6